ncbi:uncharacterized protein BJ212DRAFT_1378818 [Suillus subaureus]|uniref:Uncharacterized protein n=1 Tax=Suillus subaureus TaxID=48587 RepID=A0A9P7E310_9AGAM|nr:uncharacterized protein BJ212DRAFT_1378818 [Suillus subaureus]KAG1809662.1 hypothetical protein BJ212DRAFT_1378818 [Suillus subaureus]
MPVGIVVAIFGSFPQLATHKYPTQHQSSNIFDGSTPEYTGTGKSTHQRKHRRLRLGLRSATMTCTKHAQD